MKGTITVLGQQIVLDNLCKGVVSIPDYPKTTAAFKRLPMIKYQFSRAKWYTVQLNGMATWKQSDEYNQIIEWCTKHFGPHPASYDAWSRWYVGLGYINFRDAKDYEWYVLRWGA